jgi:hypothetical protein
MKTNLFLILYHCALDIKGFSFPLERPMERELPIMHAPKSYARYSQIPKNSITKRNTGYHKSG